MDRETWWAHCATGAERMKRVIKNTHCQKTEICLKSGMIYDVGEIFDDDDEMWYTYQNPDNMEYMTITEAREALKMKQRATRSPYDFNGLKEYPGE